MQIRKKSIALAAASMVAALYLAFQSPFETTAPFVTEVTNTDSQHSHSFTLGTLPSLKKPADGDPTPIWLSFLSLGDGRFWMGDPADLPTKKFYYHTSTPTPLNAFVEYWAAYDDDQNPKRTKQVTFSLASGTSMLPGEELPVAMPTGKSICLQSTRNPSPDDIVTFIVTIQRPPQGVCREKGLLDSADITLTYDPTVLYYVHKDTFHYAKGLPGSARTTFSGGTSPVFYNPGTVKLRCALPGSGAARAQHSCFVYLRTFGNATPGGTYTIPTATVKYFSEQDSSECATSSDAITGQTVVNSHDPNYKVATPAIFDTEATLDFEVQVQNEGDGPTRTVYFYDYLDTLVRLRSLQVVSWTTPTMPALSVVDNTARRWKIDFGNLELKGLKQAGYGSSFGEEATLAKVKLRCNLRTAELPAFRANAILNRADVRFDCNPLYRTGLSKTNIIKDTIPPEIIVDTNIVFSPVADTFSPPPLIGGMLATMGMGDPATTKYKWYPTKGVSNPFSASPTITRSEIRQYTLVASTKSGGTPSISDIQAVFHLKLPPCPLKIDIDPCAVKGKIVVTARNYGGSAGDLIWHTCKQGQDTIHVPIVSGKKKYYFGLRDEHTGCEVERVYTMPTVPCSKKTSVLNYVLTALALVLILWLILKIMRKR
jgi:hypothetical protein